MALALKDRVKETTIVVGTGTATLLGSSIGFQPFSVVGNGNTTYYCISDQFGSNWEVGIGTYTTSGNTLARTTVLASSNAGALVVFTAGIKDVFVTYPAEKGVWLDASGNAIGLGTPAAFVGTNITGTASGLTAGNVTTNANLTGAITSSGNATSLGSFTSLQLATALTNETGTGSAVFSDNASLLNPTYTGTLTGSTGVVAIGTNQIYKDASGNVGIGTSSPAVKLDVVGAVKLGASNVGMGVDLYSSINWNYSNLNIWRNSSNTATPRFVSFMLDGDSSTSTTIGGFNAIWGSYDSAPTTGSTSSALNGVMVYGAYAGHQWYTNGTPRMTINSSGNVGIGGTNYGNKLALHGGIRFLANEAAATTYTGIGSIVSDTVSISTAGSERMHISASGIVTMNAYGAGAATFSASGVISSVSDETWKIKDGIPVNPDEMIQKLKPGYWFYNAEKSPIFGTDRQLGFYAQNVNEAIGIEAAPTPEEGKPWGYYDRSVLAVTVMSLQKALTTIESLTERLTALENK